MTCRVAGTTPTPAPQSKPMAIAMARPASAPMSPCASTRRDCWAAIRLLVLHGGGNTSVKTQMTDLLGETHDVLCVKGSGWDMSTVEPAGLPAVKLAPLRRLRALDRLTDEDMVNFQRVNLLDAGAPNPSVETLLHAFLPHTFVDHTHAAAVLSLVDQPGSEALVAEVYGGHHGLRAVCDPGIPVGQARGGCLRCEARCRRADPGQARHLHIRRGCARGLRAHDRLRIACGGAPGQGSTPGVPCQDAAEGRSR